MEQAGDFTLKDAAKFLGVSTRSLGDWCRRGRWKGVAYKVGEQWFIPADAVRAVYDERKPDTVDTVQEAESALSTSLAVAPQEIVNALQLVAVAREEERQEAAALRQEVAELRALAEELLRRIPEPEAKRAGIVARVKAMLGLPYCRILL